MDSSALQVDCQLRLDASFCLGRVLKNYPDCRRPGRLVRLIATPPCSAVGSGAGRSRRHELGVDSPERLCYLLRRENLDQSWPISNFFLRGATLNNFLQTGVLAALVWASGIGATFGQRMQFPTFAGQPSGAAATWDPYGDPGMSSPGYASQPYQPAPGAYSPPSVYQPAPPMYQPAPQMPIGQPPNYSPYSPTPSSLYPDSYYQPNPYQPNPYQPSPYQVNPYQPYPGQPSFGAEAIRLLQEVRLEGTYLFGNGDEDLEVTDAEISATFAVPFFQNPAPLLITPGFAFHFFAGPTGPGLAANDLPSQTFDTYVDFAWNPQFSSWFGLELGVRPGLYTDYETLSSDSVRILGRALAAMTVSPTVQIKAGVIYLDRLDVKLLPAGGVFYTPNPDTRWEIFFPRPRYARRFTTIGNSAWWWYLAGEYGGGSWSTDRSVGSDRFDYNDLRAMFGLEWMPETQSGLRGHIEVGYVFEREIIFRSGLPPGFDPADTFMVRSGIAF